MALKNRINRKQNKTKIIDTKNPTCNRSNRVVCRPLKRISHDGPFTELKDYTRINNFNPHFLYFTFESNRFFVALLTREYCLSLLNCSVAIFMTVGMTNEFSEKVRQYRNCTQAPIIKTSIVGIVDSLTANLFYSFKNEKWSLSMVQFVNFYFK